MYKTLLVTPMSAALDKLLSPAKLNGLELPNRIIKAATYEGMAPQGKPTAQLIEFHRRIAAGGAALTTLAYCAPEPDGRLAPKFMYMHEGIRSELQQLADAVHGAGGKLSGQIAHCGGLSRNTELLRKRPVSASSYFNDMGALSGLFFTGEMNAREMDEVVANYGKAAAFMKSIGFDAIEIHFGHGYLLSQFINPLTNKRRDEYGGSVANRMRFPLRVLDAVRNAVGATFPVVGKITMTDGMAGGITVDDSIEVCRLLEKNGIDAIILSGGSSSHNPMLLFHGDSILDGLVENEKNVALKLGMKIVGPWLFKKYPYRELYFLEEARRIRAAVQCPLMYIGGCSTVESFETVMNEGFEFVQLGRTLIKDPDLVNHLREQQMGYRNGCNHCNRCAGMIDSPNGVRCVL